MRHPLTRDAGDSAPEGGPASDTAVDRPALLPQPPGNATRVTVKHDSSRTASATQVVLARYGAEVRSFLSSRTTTRVSMEDVFSAFSEDVWKGLGSVRAEGQVRSWLYVVARNALARHLRRKQRWRSRHVSAELDELQADGRRSIGTRLGDIAQLTPIVADLSEADRRLLEQRLLLALPWNEIARESTDKAGRASDADVARESARLRKRYQLLIQSLRAQLANSASSDEQD